jgi:protein-disulfide isomerase
MDTTSFLKCYDDHVFRDELQQDSIAAQQFGIEGTPTLIIAGERFPKAGETSLPDVFEVLDQKYSEATE